MGSAKLPWKRERRRERPSSSRKRKEVSSSINFSSRNAFQCQGENVEENKKGSADYLRGKTILSLRIK